MPYDHRKTFSRELFAKHDATAKIVVQSLLHQQGYTITDETECYGSHDFIATIHDIDYKIEVEQKTAWKQDHFPFLTHDVSCRKRTSNADLFYQINARGTAVMMCPMSIVKSSPVYHKDTCLGTIAEPFFAVPISDVRYFYFEDGDWFEDE